MRIDRGAGCGAAPRRLPGRRSRPPPSLFSVAPPSGQASPAHPRWPEGTGDTGQPLSNNPTTIRAPRASRCAPHSVGSGSCPRGCPRCGVPKAPKGPPRGPAATPGLCCPPGCRGFGVCSGRCSRCTLRGGTLPKVSSCRQGNLFGRAVKKKKKKQRTCTAAGTALLTASQRREGMRVSPQPTFPSQRQIYFLFFRARSTGSLLGTSASPHAAVPWETRQKSAVQGHGCAPALEQSALALSHSAFN